MCHASTRADILPIEFLSFVSGTRNTALKFVSYVLERIMHFSWFVPSYYGIHNVPSSFLFGLFSTTCSSGLLLNN